MAQPNKPAKTMSSRLLTMKFMQRAAASPSSSPSTPSEPPSKKQRLSNGSYHSSPSTPRSDAQEVEEALIAEEQRRVAALEREAADRGESKWYLSFKEQSSPAVQSPLCVVSAGFSTLDAAGAAKEDESEEDGEAIAVPQMKGRRSFGKFNRTLEKTQDPNLSSQSSSGSDSSDSEEQEDDSDDRNGAKAMIAQTRREAGEKARAERKAKRTAEKLDATRMAEERRKKHVKLNQLSSISGGGGTPTRAPSNKEMTCYKCGKKGHAQRDCTESPEQRSRRY